jgi:hypothetical protein
MRTFDFSPLYRSTIGFDRMFSMLDQLGSTECESAWNKDPVFGVIGIQSGPRG